MELIRFITQEEHDKLKEISKRKDLITNNLIRYFHAENMKKDPDVIYINNLLREVIKDFVSFSNFTEANPNNIRIQYMWSPHFRGVGWVTIDELRDGFPVLETETD